MQNNKNLYSLVSNLQATVILTLQVAQLLGWKPKFLKQKAPEIKFWRKKLTLIEGLRAVGLKKKWLFFIKRKKKKKLKQAMRLDRNKILEHKILYFWKGAVGEILEYRIKKRTTPLINLRWVNGLYGWIEKKSNKALKKKGFQKFNRYKFFMHHQLNLSYLDKLRHKNKNGWIPFRNYEKKSLFSFFRKYAKVILRGMFQKHYQFTFRIVEATRLEEPNKPKYESFKQLIESVELRPNVINALRDIYGKYVYKKTKFVLFPRKGKVFKTSLGLRGFTYFFYRDFTESMYLRWADKIKYFFTSIWRVNPAHIRLKKQRKVSRNKLEYGYLIGKDRWESEVNKKK